MAKKTTSTKLSDLRTRLEIALDPGSERSKARRDAAGKTTPRQRIDALLDKGTFVEVGQLARNLNSDKNPYGDGVVTGWGRIDGRPVTVYAHDSTVFGGSVGEVFAKKVCQIMDFALKMGCPVIGINDSGGARVQEAVTALAVYSEIGRRQLPLSGLVPQISIMLGKCAGGAVYGPVTTDFVVAVEDSYMFVTGPDVVKSVTGEDISMEELGSAHKQANYGNIHHVAEDETAAFDYVRRLLSYLPSTCHDALPEIMSDCDLSVTDADLALNSIIPDADNASYDMHNILGKIFDDGEFFEISQLYGPNIITGFARLDGKPVGVLANQPLELSGCLDARASEKGARFVRICNAYGIPVIFVVDVPGFLPGAEEERNGVIHRGAKFLYAITEATIPKLTVIVRKAYGGAYAVMGSKNLGTDLNIAWPTGRIAVMGAEGAVDVVKRHELAMATPEEAQKIRQQFISFYNAWIATPYLAAERGYIDAVVEPAKTRSVLIRALNQLADKRVDGPEKRIAIAPM